MSMPSRPLSSLGAPRVSRNLGMILFGVGMASMSAYCTKAADSGGGSGGSRGASGGSSGASGGVSGGSSGGAVGSGGNTSASGGDTGSGGVTSTGGASAGSGGAVATGGVTATGGTMGSGGTPASGSGGDTSPAGDAAVTDAACQMATVKFMPTIPTVTLLVDRSGSMFHCLTGNTGDAVCADMANTSWSNLKTAVESVMTQLDAQVRFGFQTVWGTNPVGGGMCPSLQGMATDYVAPALNNAAAISKLYDSLAFPPNSTSTGMKFESPASESIAVASKALQADTAPGSKYILFITDGQPDYCDDSNSLCAPDSVVYQLQAAATAGVNTIVFGVQTPLFDLAPGVLQAYANAGAGEPTLPPVKMGGTANDFYDQCSGVAGWAADLTASGKPAARGSTLGTYSTMMGPTMPYQPSASNLSQLVTQLTAAINGVKSCTFDLGNVGGQSIKVDLNQLASAHVCLSSSCPDSSEVPQDATNGWSMASATQLTLNGTACDKWRMPANNDISFDFPCKSIIFE